VSDKIAISPTAAASLLPIGAAEARAYLDERGLVRTWRGRRIVLVADLEATIRRDAPAPIDLELGLVVAETQPARPARRRGPALPDPRE
jgi:hypothetical protein